MDFSQFTNISFDCYGTLIDWESGLLPVLRSIVTAHGHDLTDATLLELYGQFEADAEHGSYQSYRAVLESVVLKLGERCGFVPTSTERSALHESIPGWRPFPDTVEALQRLQRRYRLAVISNIDDDLFAATRKHLGVEFAVVVTAQQARSYKPSINNFQMAIQRMGIAPDRLLHAAQSVFHDVVPAQTLGLKTAWVNRKSARPGIGAVRLANATPDLEVPDMASLATLAVI